MLTRLLLAIVFEVSSLLQAEPVQTKTLLLLLLLLLLVLLDGEVAQTFATT
jgi:hypothetical protein